MSSRIESGRLRRELRVSRSILEANLAVFGSTLKEVQPLSDAFFNPVGLLGLYGSELLMLERALGIGSGTPAVKLVGELVSVKSVPRGTGVSYGHLQSTESDTSLGLIAIGFSDGIPRSVSGKFSVEIQGSNFPSLGRIAMDQSVIDLKQSNPNLGSEANFFTADCPLEKIARDSGFAELEILGRVPARVARVWSE